MLQIGNGKSVPSTLFKLIVDALYEALKLIVAEMHLSRLLTRL